MLFELIIFAFVLTGLNVAVGLIMMKVVMTKKFYKKIVKMSMEVAQEVTEELDMF